MKAFKSLLDPSWDHLGSFWGRSWEHKSLNFIGFSGSREHRVFEEDKAWKCILDGSWVDFDAKRGPKRLPNRTQDGVKMRSKNDQKIRSVFDRS